MKLDLFHFDALNRRKMTLDVDGYRNQLTIEYATYKQHVEHLLYWKIVGYDEIFKIDLKDVYSTYGERFDLFFCESLGNISKYYYEIQRKPTKTHLEMDVLNKLSKLMY